jgi:hypothetical protein
VLFLLAHDRPPPRKVASSANPVVTPALQRVLDSLSVPAFVRTATFQIVAWNRASVLVFGDYAHVPERDRNLLRRVFGPGSETKVHDAEDLRRRCVAAFRIEVARAGASDEATALIDELSAESADFRRLWAEGVPRSARSRSNPPCSTSTAARASRCSSGLPQTNEAPRPWPASSREGAPDRDRIAALSEARRAPHTLGPRWPRWAR